jgi:hypothetical protein
MLIILYSKVNSSVQGEIRKTNAPTQNPVHMGHFSKSPKKPYLGLIPLKIEPYTKICVKP